MKVNELIEALSKLPQDLPVKLFFSNDVRTTDFEIKNLFESCDSKGENCVFLDL